MKPGSLEALQSIQAFAGAEINLAWLTQVLRVLVYHQNSHSSVYTKPQIYEKELTD